VTKTNQLRNILAIESAVAGGSVALIREETGEILRREGLECSRAEKLISIVSGVLDEAELELGDVNLIAVSIGPGSYSGIRIGLSTALGLGNARGIKCRGISVLDAMTWGAGIVTSPLVVAIPVGKNDIACRIFTSDDQGNRAAGGDPELLSSANFINQMKSLPNTTLFAHTDLCERIGDQIPETTPCVDAGIGMAEFVARYASREHAAPNNSLQPIYLRNRDTVVRSAGF